MNPCLCPKHRQPLSVSNMKLDIFGVKRNVAVGSCPDCNVKYMNFSPMGSPEFVLDGVRYQYIPGMAYRPKEESKPKPEEVKPQVEEPPIIQDPPPKKDIKPTNTAKTKSAKKLKNATKEKKKKTKKSVAMPTINWANWLAANSKKAKKKNQLTKQQQQILIKSLIEKIQSQPPEPDNRTYLAYKIHVVKSPAHFCPICKSTLITPQKIKFVPKNTYTSNEEYCKKCQMLITTVTTDDSKTSVDYSDTQVSQSDTIKEQAKSIRDTLSKFSDDILLSLIVKDGSRVAQVSITTERGKQDLEAKVYWVERSFVIPIFLSVMLDKPTVPFNNNDCEFRVIYKGPKFMMYANRFSYFCLSETPRPIHLYRHKWAPMGEPVTAFINFPSIKQVMPIVVYYYARADIYFINETTYYEYVKQYGIPYLKPVPTFSDYESTFDWRKNSELSIYGYTVSKSSGKTIKERQSLLAQLMDAGIMSKTSIMNHLEFLINLHSYDKTWDDAREAWRRDLVFTRDYKINTHRIIWGKLEM